MIKPSVVALLLATFAGSVSAQQADPCSGLAASASDQCRANQQKLQLEQLQQQVQQQQERQRQLDEQQRQIQQQLDNMRLQNETLRAQVAHPSASQPARPPATDYSKTPEVKSWRSDNPWFGSDYAKTEFAVRYAKQLQQERPDLVGRPFLDALSAKVNENFSAKNR